MNGLNVVPPPPPPYNQHSTHIQQPGPIPSPSIFVVSTANATPTPIVVDVSQVSPTAVTSSGRTNTSCFEDPNFTVFLYTVDDLILAASMVATVFNLLVLYCAFRLWRRSGDTMHLFILNMTIGDLILTVFSHPNELLIRRHSFLQNVHLCSVIHFANWLGLAVSGLSLTLLNVDKLIYFQWPLSYDRSMSRRRALALCATIWLASIGFIGYCWLFDIAYIHKFDCSLQLHQKFFYEIFLMLFCVLPVLSSLLVSCYLFRLTRQKRAAIAAHSQSPTQGVKLKSLIFIWATTAWTSCSLLPYRLLNLARIHLFSWQDLTCEEKITMNWTAWILLYLLTINPIVNPFITSLIYAPYRMTIKKLLVNIPASSRAGGGGASLRSGSSQRVSRRFVAGPTGTGARLLLQPQLKQSDSLLSSPVAVSRPSAQASSEAGGRPTTSWSTHDGERKSFGAVDERNLTWHSHLGME